SLKGWCGCVPLPPAALKVGRCAKDKNKGAPDVRFGSKADIRRSLRQRPLYPRKRTSAVGPGMSRFVPEADLKRPLMRCPLWPRHHCGLSCAQMRQQPDATGDLPEIATIDPPAARRAAHEVLGCLGIQRLP